MAYRGTSQHSISDYLVLRCGRPTTQNTGLNKLYKLPDLQTPVVITSVRHHLECSRWLPHHYWPKLMWVLWQKRGESKTKPTWEESHGIVELWTIVKTKVQM